MTDPNELQTETPEEAQVEEPQIETPEEEPLAETPDDPQDVVAEVEPQDVPASEVLFPSFYDYQTSLDASFFNESFLMYKK